MVLMMVCDITRGISSTPLAEAVGRVHDAVIQVGFNCGTWTQLNREFGSAAGEPGFDYSGEFKLGAKLPERQARSNQHHHDRSSRPGQVRFPCRDDERVDYLLLGLVDLLGTVRRHVYRENLKAELSDKSSKVLSSLPGLVFSLSLVDHLWSSVSKCNASEMALDVAVDKNDWSIGLHTHYTDNAPSSAKAIALADKGYYLLSCRAHNDRILDAMEPYGKLTPFMHLLTLVELLFYFVTSSDSGSFVDDIISAQVTRTRHGSNAYSGRYRRCHCRAMVAFRFGLWIGTIQAVSIVAGLPYTIAICYCCTSLYRALKREMRDEDIMSQRRGFVVSSLDILELYSPEDMPRQSPSSGERFKSNIIALFFPHSKSQDRRMCCVR